jgi:hypothetical protein
VALPISGPQAYGAAQSYVEKQFLRQVFKIPTGDKDADDTAPSTDAPGGRSGARTAQEGSGAPRYPARQQAAPQPSDAGADARKRYSEIIKAITDSQTLADLDALAISPAWVKMEELVHAAEGEARATELIARLDRGIADRKAALGGGGSLRDFEV